MARPPKGAIQVRHLRTYRRPPPWPAYSVVVIREQEGRYLVAVPTLKGCHTWGADIGHALMMARDAIEEYLAVLKEDGDPIPEEGRLVPVEMGEAKEALVYRLESEEW